MDSGSKLLKCVIFFVDFVFALTGLALVAAGGVSLAGIGISDAYIIPIIASVLLFLGAVIFFTALVGGCGAVKESSCMLTTFALFLTIFAICELAVAVVIFTYPEKIQSVSEVIPRLSFNETINTKLGLERFEQLQSMLQCCGADGPKDYDGTSDYSGDVLPSSCCVAAPATELITEGPVNNTNSSKTRALEDSALGSKCKKSGGTSSVVIFTTGCGEKMAQSIKMYENIVAAAAILLATLQGVGAIFTCVLCFSIRSDRQKYTTC